MCQLTTVLPVLTTFETITRPKGPTTPLGAPELRFRDPRQEGRTQGVKKQKKIATLHKITESVAVP